MVSPPGHVVPAATIGPVTFNRPRKRGRPSIRKLPRSSSYPRGPHSALREQENCLPDDLRRHDRGFGADAVLVGEAELALRSAKSASRLVRPAPHCSRETCRCQPTGPVVAGCAAVPGPASHNMQGYAGCATLIVRRVLQRMLWVAWFGAGGPRLLSRNRPFREGKSVRPVRRGSCSVRIAPKLLQ